MKSRLQPLCSRDAQSAEAPVEGDQFWSEEKEEEEDRLNPPAS